MSTDRRTTSEKILNAISNRIRIEIIKKLSRAGEYSFTELMTELNMSPRTDAGKFGYHIKLLSNSGIIATNPKNGRYILTDLGKMLADLIWELEEITRKKEKKILVRTSELIMEPFERRKITEALMREARAPRKIAEIIAKEAEERILQSNISYLTAPLIREFVNAILLEQGLEDYRHSLTRLGLPVYDVERMLEMSRPTALVPIEIHAKAGNAVMSEYALMKELPRRISEAHMSGSIHISNISCWGLKPATIHHDVSFFLKHGLKLGELGYVFSNSRGARSFKEALDIILRLAYIMHSSISVGQVVDDINVVLAPFIRNMKYDEIKREIKEQLIRINQLFSYEGKLLPVAFGMSIKDESEYFEEELSLFRAFMEVMCEGDHLGRPFLTPLPIIKLKEKDLDKYEEEVQLLCKLISKWSTPYIINLDWQTNMAVSYCWDLSRLSKGEGDVNRLKRTGQLDSVLINLPRIALEANGNDEIFFSKLNDAISISIEALREKMRILKKRMNNGLLALLTMKAGDDPYYNLDDAYGNIGYVGLSEAVKIHTGEEMTEDDDALRFAEKIVNYMVRKTSKRRIKVKVSGISVEDPGRRLLKTDIARFGIRSLQEELGRNLNKYTSGTNVPYELKIPLKTRINIESKFQRMTLGGHGLNIFLKNPIPEPNYLFKVLSELIESKKLGAFTFSKDFTYCRKCGSMSDGLYDKCPKCGRSINNIVNYVKEVNIYQPVNIIEARYRNKYII